MTTLLPVVFFSLAAARTPVPAGHAYISFDGAPCAVQAGDSVILNRFPDDIMTDTQTFFNPLYARTTSGIVVRFRIASSFVKASFSPCPDGAHRGIALSIYQDGEHDTDFDYGIVETPVACSTTSRHDGREVTYEIVLPPYDYLALTGLVLDDGDSLAPNLPDNRPRYFAVGNSITHGMGQGSFGRNTYPFILSRKMGWKLFNCAIGGSRTSPSVGAMIQDLEPDVITVLWGLNDWYYQNNLPSFETRYQLLLENIRQSHPNVPVYCITPLSTIRAQKPEHEHLLDDYRQTIRDEVAARQTLGDSGIHLIEGPEISTADDLRDEVHLNTAGAARVADSLYARINGLDPTNVRNGAVEYSTRRHIRLLRAGSSVPFSVSRTNTGTITLYTLDGSVAGSYPVSAGKSATPRDGGNTRRHNPAAGLYFYRVTDSEEKSVYGRLTVVKNAYSHHCH